jgi:hypothetical protein
MKSRMMMKLGMSGVLLCAVAMADHGGNDQGNAFTSGIVGSMPNQVVAGVSSGGAPWVVREGHAKLTKKGKLNVEVEGLLIAAGLLANGNPVPQNLVGTTATVMFVAASLVCGGTVVDSTPAVALSAAGNAEMEGKVNAPAACATPAVLVRIAPSITATGLDLKAFIALSGSVLANDDDKDDHGKDETGRSR